MSNLEPWRSAPGDGLRVRTFDSGAPRPGEVYADSQEDVVDLGRLLSVLKANALLITGTAAFVVALSFYLVLTAEPQYRATAVVRFQSDGGSLTSGIAGAGIDGIRGRTYDPLMSELETLRSRTVASEVVDATALRLLAEPASFSVGALEGLSIEPNVLSDTLDIHFNSSEFVVEGRRQTATAGYGERAIVAGVSFGVPSRPTVDGARVYVLPKQQAVARFFAGLVAQPREQTNVVSLEFTSPDPRLSQQVVNATVDVFGRFSAEAAQQQSRRRRVFLEQQLVETDSMLALAQLALSDFRRRETVYSSRERFSAQQSGLMGLEVRREELHADRRMYEMLLEQFETAGSPGTRGLETLVSSPEIASNTIVSQLYGQLVSYQVARDTLTTGRWGSASGNPDVERIEMLIASTEGRLLEAVRSHVASLDARIAALDEMQLRTAAELRSLPESEAEEVRLTQRLETIQSVADQLRGDYQRARIAEAVEAGNVEVVDLATLPLEPIAGGKGMKLALGLVLGLMLGSGGAFLREHLNTSIRRNEELESVLRVSGLGIIPRLGSQGRATRLLSRARSVANGTGSRSLKVPSASFGDGDLISVSGPRSSGAEAYRMLRTNLIFSQAVQTLRRIVVTSSGPEEGKTTTVANLAIAFAQQGMRVLVVDCDLRKARMHKVFGLTREPGLTQLVLSHVPAEEAIRTTSVEGLFVLPAGVLPPNPAEFVGGELMRSTISSLSADFDMVIIDTPPLHAASDAAVLGVHSDGVLLVVRAGQTERGAAQQAVQQLEKVGARIIGAVLNDPDAKVPTYGSYYAYDYYGADA